MSIFDTLRFSGRRPPIFAEEESEAMSLAVARAVRFADWATRDEGAEFVKYLDNLIGFAEAEEAESIDSHARLAFARGKREALGALRAEFNKWRDSAA